MPENPMRTIQPGTVFELARNLTALSPSLKLRNVEWGVLFAVGGGHTVAQIGQRFGLSAAERDRAFLQLAASGLIRERKVSHGEYLLAMATVGDEEPKSLVQFLTAGAAMGSEPGVVASASPPRRAASPAPPPPAPDLDDETINLTRAVPTVGAVSFRPLETPPSATARAVPGPSAAETSPAADARRLSLKALMRFISSRAEDSSAGQLDVYRVFIRVSTKLLKRNGITTLRFEDDHLVNDPELQTAILSSVQKTLGLTCPQDVFT